LQWLDKNVVSDTFGFAFDSVLELEFGWVENDIGGIFIELKEGLDKL
jgi:hypothetical protein